MLLGREQERQQIDLALAQARSGASAALALVGEPGIGKTALLEDAAERATGMQLLRARGIESEAQIPFASLLELLRPALAQLEKIPQPQAVALEGALALRPAASHERFAIGAATLSLLAAYAEEGPARPSKAAATLAGKLVIPEHASFDEARQAWNLAVDQRPAAVAFPEDPQDVTSAVQFAREHGLRVAPQGTGHNAPPLGDLSDTLLLKTERMRGVQIDPHARLARVQAGALWLEVVQAAARHGLAALAGSSPDVGVVGYTLGGGMSWLGRKYGLASNNVEAIDVVTADGRTVRADHDHEADLFWALRGGGGSFGVVTAIELRLFPITDVYAGIMWFPIERGVEVLHAWRELTMGDLPDELTTVGRYLQLPPFPEIPEPVRGKSFVLVEAIHLGEPAQADELLSPLRALGPVNDTIDTIPVEALSHLHMDPEQPVPGTGDGATLARLPVEAIDALDRVAGAGSGSPLLSVEIRHLQGEFARPRADAGALAAFDAGYVLYAVGITPTPEATTIVGPHVERLIESINPWVARQTYLNFAETNRAHGAFWSAQAYDRLRRIKADVDPDELIRSNHPVRAA